MEAAMTETIDRLYEIKTEIADLIAEARELLQDTPEAARAEAYWIAHIRCALDNDHDYLGGSMATMQESIDALTAEADR
jgi:ElaB/YqjD/DUF883 family membrane-anchored ribosome-binding protein